ncbi:MAG TPA: thioesterase family protein [Stellaceae bacterium]|jgi:acyl-CoA thioester hydrolase|nr:thioesterase family protein [Stellaceae bacterium]
MPPAGKSFVELAFPPRTYDIDFAGVVNNIVYIRWLEDLRLALMAPVYPIERALREDVAPILLSTNIAYDKPATIQDSALVGRMWVPAMERIKWHVAAEFAVGEMVHARAEQVGLFIKLSTRKPIAPPAPLRTHYAP